MFPDYAHFTAESGLGLQAMTITTYVTTSVILQLCIYSGHTYGLMRPNVRAAPTLHADIGITNFYSYIKFESCPLAGPLNSSCTGKYAALRTRFGPPVVKDLIGGYQAVSPPDACEDISPTHLTARKYMPYIAIVNRDNCSFEVKVYNAEKAGYRAVIIYANKEDKDLLNMSTSNPSLRVTIPSYSVSHATGTMLAYSSKLVNGSRPSMLLIATRKKPFPPNLKGKLGAINANSGEDEDGDNFGEHYFHICIYIWACVVVSSLIGLSVKWGCCGRSLTRWEVTKIPLKRFRRNSASDYQDKCPICHEEFHEGRLIRQLPCNHCYHSYCVDRWLVKMSNRCPLCKQRVSVSLFCSWSKQRDGQGGIHTSDADLDAEEASVVGELPPLPPVQSLTPNTLYGDVIMSGPSKFILMRPGKATRVIEVPKKEVNISNQNKQYNQSATDDCHQQHKQQHQTHAIVSTPPIGKHTDMSSIKMTKDCNSGACVETPHYQNHQDASPSHSYPPLHNYQQNNFQTPHKSSRSSSITSEHPLLIEEDHGSIVSLHSISDSIISDVGGGERVNGTTHNTCAHGKSAGDYQQDTKCVTSQSYSQRVYPKALTNNRKMESSDSSDYGCHCDCVDDRIGGNIKCDNDDSIEHHRCRKKVALEVNVNLNPRVFHADIEQHYSRVAGPDKQEQQLSLKRDSRETSMSSNECSSDEMHLYGDATPTTTTTVTSNSTSTITNVNSCKNCIDDGKYSNSDFGVNACLCSANREGPYGQDDPNKDSKADHDTVQASLIKCHKGALSSQDARGGIDVCSGMFNSFLKQSSNNPNPKATTPALSCNDKSRKTVAVEVGQAQSLWQVVASWDGSLRRGLSKTNRKRRYCSGKNVKTL